MKQPKLKYHFHNPNPPDKSAEYILKILMQVNAVKAENAVKSAQEKIKNEDWLLSLIRKYIIICFSFFVINSNKEYESVTIIYILYPNISLISAIRFIG